MQVTCAAEPTSANRYGAGVTVLVRRARTADVPAIKSLVDIYAGAGRKLLAKELQVPVIALSQLNRGPEQRADKLPALSDLRESGSIEQDADLVMFLYREEYYDREMEDDSKKGVAEVIIAKHRNGPTGSFNVAWMSRYAKFASLSAQHS